MNKFSSLRYLSIISLSFISAISNLHAQDASDKENQLTITAQLRPKFEYRDGNFQPLAQGLKPSALISQRSRLTFSYQYKNALTLQVSPQTVTVWGQDALTQGASTSNGFGLFEAWAGIRTGEKTIIKAGRQVISLDDERFFGELDWAQGSRAHDAVSLHVANKKADWKLFAAYNQNYRELYGNNLYNVAGSLFSTKDAAPYKWMQTAWGKFQIGKGNTLSALVSNLGFQNAKNTADPAKTYFLQTLGLTFNHTGTNWKYQVAGYLQQGKNLTGNSTDGHLISLGIDRTISKIWNLGLGADYLSGNKVNNNLSAHNRAFVPYFGTNHKFYGSMDYFYAGNGHKNAGLEDFYLKTGFKPNANFNLNVALHQFMAPVEIKEGSKTLPSNLGQELDLDFGYSINKYAKLTGGYSMYFNTPTLLYLKNVAQSGKVQQWAWISLNVNPKILYSKY
ncbi:MAG: hypothetical protein E6Q58_04985 [Niabella sp.]|nr:MAG: hypothetical protein E6Q58_04985 [Niabella sp.]